MLNQVVGAFGLYAVVRFAHACQSQHNQEGHYHIEEDIKAFNKDALEPFRPYLPDMFQKIKIPIGDLYLAGTVASCAALWMFSGFAFLLGNNHFAAIVLSATVLAICAGEVKNKCNGSEKEFGQEGLDLARQFTKETHKFLKSFIREDSSLTR